MLIPFLNSTYISIVATIILLCLLIVLVIVLWLNVKIKRKEKDPMSPRILSAYITIEKSIIRSFVILFYPIIILSILLVFGLLVFGAILLFVDTNQMVLFEIMEKLIYVVCTVQYLYLIPFISYIMLTLLENKHFDFLHPLKYQKGGSLYKWFEVNKNFLDEINWIPEVIKSLASMLRANGVDKTINLLSIGSGKGIIESELANKISEVLDVNVIADVSDINAIWGHETDYTRGKVVYRYKEGVNADDIEQHYPDQKFDIIWINKSDLWFKAESKDTNSLVQAFHRYHKLLNDKGLIVIEAHEQSSFHQKVLFHTFGSVKGFIEPSTYKYIERKMKDTNLKKEISILFDEYIVGEGNYKMVFYRKK